MDSRNSDVFLDKGIKLSKLFDHTLLKASATKNQIETLCRQAIEYDVYSVCVFPCYVEFVKKLLEGSSVKITTVVGFPFGTNESRIKAEEADLALQQGASEIDMVVNLGMYFDGLGSFQDEIKMVRKVCSNALLKTIIETSYLTPHQIQDISTKCIQAGSDYIKTSTGYSQRGCSSDDIRAIKEVVDKLNVGRSIGIKASGGVKSLDQVEELVSLGATRIGASSTVKILEEYNQRIKK